MKADRPLLGITLMIGFALFAPGMDAMAKLVAGNVPVGQIAAFRFSIQALLLVPLAIVLGRAHIPNGHELGLHLIRAVLIVVATSCFFYALRSMPIADAISIFFVEPFILTLLGGLILKEAVGPRRIIACLVGFGGALLVIKPSFSQFGLVAALPLATALLFAFYMLLTRSMAQRMNPIALQGYTAVAAMIVVFPALALMNGTGSPLADPIVPTVTEVKWLIGVGVMATFTHIMLSYALAFAPAATIAPLQYIEIISATLLGMWIFGDFPDGLTWVGIAIIVGSGIYVFHRERINR
jgi:drug/metabolite transporter (DMT)-like permease